MPLNKKIATVFGGTGFVGRQIVRELANGGYTVKVASRVPERANFLKTCGAVGQIVPFACDYFSGESIAEAIKGSSVVVNCIGILFEKGKKKRFEHAHAQIPSMIAEACAAAKTRRFVHISAMGVDRSNSSYARTKRVGEDSVRGHFPNVTILRPSVIFGEDDQFFNMFARMSMILPVLPLIGGGHTKFQPVYVGDVAAAVMAAIENDETAGQIYELGGPEVVTFREIYERLFLYTKRRVALMTLPFSIAKIQGMVFGVLPHPPLTADQVESLKTDNIVGPEANTLADLGIAATGMDLILPGYLSRYQPGGRFGAVKAAD
jgi:uncharacterized protein YbjT (DUF2867 family)